MPFPWKSRDGQQLSLIENARHYASYFLMADWLLLPTSQEYLQKDILIGTECAFRIIVRSIFSNFTSSSKAIELERNNVDTLPTVDEIFDSRLARLYLDAIEASKKANYLIEYNLISIATPSVVKCEILFGTKRGNSMMGLIKTYTFGIEYFFPLKLCGICICD